MPPGFSVQRFVDKKTAIGAVSWDTAEMTALPEMAWDGDDSLFHILLLHGDLYGKDSPYLPLDLQRLQEIPAHYTCLLYTSAAISVGEPVQLSPREADDDHHDAL